MAQSDALNANERKALLAILENPTIRGAAKACGLGERTLYRYLEKPAFKAELRKVQDGLIASASSALAGLSGEAIETLGKVMRDKDTPRGVKVRAAVAILGQRRKSTELDDLTQRVQALETTSAE